ncbi:hypothetical protein B0H13DRAFT_1922018, partial [Mycena leptocephala]
MDTRGRRGGGVGPGKAKDWVSKWTRLDRDRRTPARTTTTDIHLVAGGDKASSGARKTYLERQPGSPVGQGRVRSTADSISDLNSTHRARKPVKLAQWIKKYVSPDARQSPLLPMEVLLIVFGMLRDVSDESAAAIFHRKAERRRLMQVCPTFAAACRGTPSLWSDIVVQLPELGRLFHTTEYSIQNQLHLSRNRPLRIVFDAPFTTAPDSERHKIWEMLKATTVRVR